MGSAESFGIIFEMAVISGFGSLCLVRFDKKKELRMGRKLMGRNIENNIKYSSKYLFINIL